MFAKSISKRLMTSLAALLLSTAGLMAGLTYITNSVERDMERIPKQSPVSDASVGIFQPKTDTT